MDDTEDGGMDVSESIDFAEETYQDFVAERAAAFGFLAVKLETIKDEKVRELGRTMLRTMIRSIRTPPDAELTEMK